MWKQLEASPSGPNGLQPSKNLTTSSALDTLGIGYETMNTPEDDSKKHACLTLKKSFQFFLETKTVSSQSWKGVARTSRKSLDR